MSLTTAEYVQKAAKNVAFRMAGVAARVFVAVATTVSGMAVAQLAVPKPTLQQAVQIVDDRGVVVRFEAPPQRVVSLLPSLSETVCALGHCGLLVGVDRYSNFPLRLQKLPQLGGGLDPSIEAVLAQKPDVVLLATSSRASGRLEALGLKVVALEPKTHADVRRVLKSLGALLAVPDPLQVWRGIDAEVAAAAGSLPERVRRTKVFMPVSAAPHGAGEASFMGETLLRLGAQNIVPRALGVFPKLNPEFVVQANPDIIMVSDRASIGLVDRPGWKDIRAIRERRVCRFTPAQADVLVRAGPRMAEAARLMADCLRAKAP